MNDIRVPGPVEILQKLISFDTSNPPGREVECAQWLNSLLLEHQISSQILAPDDASHRASVVARIKGDGESPPLLLYGHLDVVSIHGQVWTRDPFSGDLADGCVWGRGAVDMKGGLAMMIHALIRARYDDQPPPGDVIFAAVADEEDGGEAGAGFLTKRHAEIFKDVRHALGEVGGFTTHIRGKRFYPVMVAEKHICRIELTFQGAGGHGSQIHVDTATSRAAEALRRLEKAKPPYRITPVTREMVRSIGQSLPFPANLVMRMVEFKPSAGIALRIMGSRSARMLEPMLRNVITPTIIRGGVQENASPAQVKLLLDCRLLPGDDQSDIVNQVRRIVGPDPQIEVMRYDTGPSPAEMSLFPFLAEILERADPGSVAIPFMVAGGTDAKWFQTIGIDTYGFTPMILPPDLDFMGLFHGTDERIPIEAVNRGSDMVYQAVREYRPQG